MTKHGSKAGPPGHPPINYWDYIRVPELLGLQGGLERDEGAIGGDEVVFITVHQVYELWLKLILRDLAAARGLFANPRVEEEALPAACRKLERIRVAIDQATSHMRLMETVTTRDYLEFRDKLFPANGGQSPQFREIEILMGLEESERLPYTTGGSYLDILSAGDGEESWALRRVQERLADRPTLREAVDEWLYRSPVNGSRPGDATDDEVVSSFIGSYMNAYAAAQPEGSRAQVDDAARFLRAGDRPPEERGRRSRIRAAALFIEIYRELPLLAWPREVLDGLVDVEQSFVTFRQRHARMAERLIGRRAGTGGSAGVDYLDEVARRYRVFGDLGAVRTLLVRRGLVPDPVHPESYGFRFES